MSLATAVKLKQNRVHKRAILRPKALHTVYKPRPSVSQLLHVHAHCPRGLLARTHSVEYGESECAPSTGTALLLSPDLGSLTATAIYT